MDPDLCPHNEGTYVDREEHMLGFDYKRCVLCDVVLNVSEKEFYSDE